MKQAPYCKPTTVKPSVIPLVINNIITLRNQHGYSQEYMAQQMGLSTQSYSNIERQITQLSAAHIESIAQVLDVDPCVLWFFNLTPRDEYAYKLHQSYLMALNKMNKQSIQIDLLIQQNALLTKLLHNK